MNCLITDWLAFEDTPGYYWRRVGECMAIIYPINAPLMLPIGFQIDRSKLPNPDISGFPFSEHSRIIQIPILGWTNNTSINQPSLEFIYFQKPMDTHGGYSRSRYTIPVTGWYWFKREGKDQYSKDFFSTGDVLDKIDIISNRDPNK
jgi:hypothetical protein